MYIIIDNENVHSLNAKEKSSFIEQSSSDDQISLILESDDDRDGSPDVFCRSINKKILCVGTVMKDRKHLPPSWKTKKLKMEDVVQQCVERFW